MVKKFQVGEGAEMSKQRPWTVADLVATLQSMPQHAQVRLSSDPEGNRIRELFQVNLFHAELNSWGETEFSDTPPNSESDEAQLVVTLWPK